MFLEQKIESILASLKSIEDKVDRLMAESEEVKADLASLKVSFSTFRFYNSYKLNS